MSNHEHKPTAARTNDPFDLLLSSMIGLPNGAWAWLNAVTEYADHHVSARSDDNRFNSSQFGAGDKLKNDALELLAS